MRYLFCIVTIIKALLASTKDPNLHVMSLAAANDIWQKCGWLDVAFFGQLTLSRTRKCNKVIEIARALNCKI